jgi:hypothetical protein
MTGLACGYRSAAYAASLAALGRAVPLGDTGAFVIEREIAGSAAVDFMGPYPLLSCTDWDALGEALAGLGADAVSLTLVTDPFCPLSVGQLAAIFPLCRPLHDHYLIDLDAPPADAADVYDAKVTTWQRTVHGVSLALVRDLAVNSLHAARLQKDQLLAEPETICTVDFATAATLHLAGQVRMRATRPGTLHGLCGGIFESIRESIEETCRSASLNPGRIDKVLLTGGTSQVPFIQRMIEHIFSAERILRPGYFSSVASGLGRLTAQFEQ